MGNILYTIAVILIVIWLVGFFGFQLGGMIHILLAASLITVLIRVLSGSSSDDPI